MNTYELNIRKKDESTIYHKHIDCEESNLKDNLNNFCINGILVDLDDDKNRIFIPGYRIDYIKVSVLERVQNILDVNDSIKAALTEK